MYILMMPARQLLKEIVLNDVYHYMYGTHCTVEYHCCVRIIDLHHCIISSKKLMSSSVVVLLIHVLTSVT